MFIIFVDRKTAIEKWVTPSGSSNYSTCSDNDNPIKNMNFNENNMHTSTQSVILAGQMSLEESLAFNIPSCDFNDFSCSENILDQNLDVIVENDDVFVNCNEDNNVYLSENDSTQYIPLESISKLEKMKSGNYYHNNFTISNNLYKTEVGDTELNDLLSDAAKLSIEQERLITIMEESEVATNSMVKNSKSINIGSTTGEYLVDMITQLKKYEQINDCNKNVTKKVVFANDHNIINNDENDEKTNEMKLKGQKKNPNPLVGKNKCFVENKNINRNYNYENTTESFVKWERLCQNSENSRRSFSFSELSCLTESYCGDDEYSTSFKTLDDIYIDSVGNKSNLQNKFLLHRSKSCDTLPKEEKHLPHIVYDFLKTLSKAIEHLKKQSVVCTCEHCIPNRKHSSKVNNLKTETKSLKVTDEQKGVKGKYFLLN